MNIVTTTVDYFDGDTLLEAYLAYPDPPQPSGNPAVMLAHMWGGRVEFVCQQARRFAALGYTAFALDMYGKGVLGANPDENARLMQPFIDDRRMLQRRINAALEILRGLRQAETTRIAAIGYCFGGLCVLDLARSGADIQGVVCIHGLLDPFPGKNDNPIKSKILLLHGSEDPQADINSLLAVQQELTDAGVDWQTVIYSDTQHAFTNPAANDPARGTVYNPLSDQRAWKTLLNFLEECFE